MRRQSFVLALFALVVLAAGFAAATFAFGETTGTVTAAIPDQTITIPGTTVVQTYTIPTVTQTVTQTVTAPPPPPPPPPAFVSCGGVFAPTGTPACADPDRVLARTFEPPETLHAEGSVASSWWGWIGLEPNTSTVSIVTDPANSANRVMKGSVAPQPGPKESGYPYYSEFAVTLDSRDSGGRQGNDRWYRWKLRLDPNWQGAPNTTFNWLHEFLDEPGSPGACAGQLNYNDALGINTTPNPDTWVYQVGYAGTQTTGNCAGTRPPTQFAGPAVVKGQWQTFVEHFHWSADSDGLLELWIDGALAFRITGPNIYRHPNGSTGNETEYWMDYRSNYSGSNATTTDVSFWDDVVIGRTQASVGG